MNMNITTDNQEVEVTSLYFRTKPTEHRLDSYPKQMVYDGREYTFIESSMQYLIRTGQNLIKLFDVSDGKTLFRLRLEGGCWTLVSMKTGTHYAESGV
jgi:hypothetical protein